MTARRPDQMTIEVTRNMDIDDNEIVMSGVSQTIANATASTQAPATGYLPDKATATHAVTATAALGQDSNVRGARKRVRTSRVAPRDSPTKARSRSRER